MKPKFYKTLIPINTPDLDLMFESKIDADRARVVFKILANRIYNLKKNPAFAPALSRDERWCPVSSDMFKEIIGHNTYYRIIKKLKDEGLIEVRKNESGREGYVPRMYTKLYQVSEASTRENEGRSYRLEKITHPKVVKKILSYYSNTYKSQRDQIPNWYKPCLGFLDKMYVDIDQKDVKHDDVLMASMTFNNGSGRFVTQDKFSGRIHSHIVALPKVLRPYLKLEYEDTMLVEADIKNSQPYFLGLCLYKPELVEQLLPEFGPIMDTLSKYSGCPDVYQYLCDCIAGKLYDNFCDILVTSRSEVKKLLFHHVFYSPVSNHMRPPKKKSERLRTWNAFKSLYPNVFEAFQEIKLTDRKILPWVYKITKRGKPKGRMFITLNLLAQRIEKAILIDLITRECSHQNIECITIHDSWIIKITDAERFKRVLNQTFHSLEVPRPRLEVNLLNGTQ